MHAVSTDHSHQHYGRLGPSTNITRLLPSSAAFNCHPLPHHTLHSQLKVRPHYQHHAPFLLHDARTATLLLPPFAVVEHLTADRKVTRCVAVRATRSPRYLHTSNHLFTCSLVSPLPERYWWCPLFFHKFTHNHSCRESRQCPRPLPLGAAMPTSRRYFFFGREGWQAGEGKVGRLGPPGRWGQRPMRRPCVPRRQPCCPTTMASTANPLRLSTTTTRRGSGGLAIAGRGARSRAKPPTGGAHRRHRPPRRRKAVELPPTLHCLEDTPGGIP